MQRDATTRQILAVADRASDDDCCRLELRLGSAQLFVDDGSASTTRYESRAELLTLLGQVDFDGVIRVPSSGLRSVSITPRDRDSNQNTFAAAAATLRALDGASGGAAVDSVISPFDGTASAVLVNAAQDPDVRRRGERLLDLAAQTDTIDAVEVGDRADSTAVSTTVAELDEVQASWQRLAPVVTPVPGTLIKVRVGDTEEALLISGPATDSPARALAVAGAMSRASGTPSYLRTDLSFLGADVTNPAAAGRLARAVQSLVPAESRLDAAWGPLAARGDGNQIGDQVDVVADLAPRLAVLAKQGYGVGWERTQYERRLVAQPLKVDSVQLSRVVSQIRAAGWPGEAQLDLSLGVSNAGGSCANTLRLVSLRSTADGPGRDFTSNGCTDPEDVQTARQAWNAGASAAAG